MADGGHQLAILMAYIKQVPSYSFTAFISSSILYFYTSTTVQKRSLDRVIRPTPHLHVLYAVDNYDSPAFF